jgi:hypothetical protein
MVLAESPLIEPILEMKGHEVRRLQIATVLCGFEAFCTRSGQVDGVRHVFVSSLFEKPDRLMGPRSSHRVGREILDERGVDHLKETGQLWSWRTASSSKTLVRTAVR